MKTFSFLRDKGLSQTEDFKGIGNIIYDMFRMWYHIHKGYIILCYIKKIEIIN